jgi:histone-binding protein RBBP4
VFFPLFPNPNPSEHYEHCESKGLNDEFKTWKKHAPYLYDTVITHVLEWPSLTVQWLPIKDTSEDSSFTKHKLLLGTHTSDGEPNYLMIAKVRLPKEEALIDLNDYQYCQKKEGVQNANSVEIETIIPHEGEVNKARYMPQKYNVIATKTNSGEVHIFDYSGRHSKPDTFEVRPDLRLAGHTQQGYFFSELKK